MNTIVPKVLSNIENHSKLVKDIGRANEELYSQFVAVTVENDQLRVIIKSPGPGRYGLILFKGSKDSDTMVQFSAVMVEFTVEAMERQGILELGIYWADRCISEPSLIPWERLPIMFFKNNQAAADSLGLLLKAQKIGLRLSRGSKSYQTVKHGEEAEFKLMHEEDFYMLLKSDTEGN